MTIYEIFIIGINIADEREKEKIDKKVESKVKEIVEKLKESHSKFVDIDFGPTEKDEFGAISFYGNGKPDPAGSKYPSPDTLKWERPLYSDEKFGKNEGESGSSNAADDDTEEEDEEFDEEDDDEYGISLDRQDDNNVSIIYCFLSSSLGYFILF